MNKGTQSLPSRSGFTLVELLIVIIVLALLTVVSGTAYTATMKTARDGRRKIDLESIRSALEVYRSDYSSYPDVTYPALLSSVLDPEPPAKKYITMPKDPKTKTDYYYIPADCELINGVTICNSYILAVALENDPGNASETCVGLTLPSGDSACTDTESNPIACNYCVDPYGQLTPTPFAPGPPPG